MKHEKGSCKLNRRGGIGGHLTVEVGDPDERKQLQDLDEKVATVPRLQVLHEEPVDH